MDQKKFVSRKGLLGQMVAEADDFTALRYLKHREGTPRLLQLEEDGAKALPNVVGALGDLYSSLWALEPELKPAEETPKSLMYWRQMLESALATSAYQEMHARTQLEELASLVGTISMADEVIKMMPEEDRNFCIIKRKFIVAVVHRVRALHASALRIVYSELKNIILI